MKTSFSKNGLTALATMGLAASAATTFAQGIYVEQVGATGSTGATNLGTALFLNQYSTSFMAGTSLNLTNAGVNTIVDSGTATSEGALTQSGNFLTFAGYDAPVGGTNAAGGSIASSTYARGVGIYNVTTGKVDDTTQLNSTTSYSGNNIRSATTTDGVTIYTSGVAASGATGGVRMTTDGSTTSNATESTISNTRYVESYAGNVYFSTGTGTGIYELTGTGGTGTPTAIVTNSTSLTSPYGFVFTNNGTVLYIADSSTGIQKFTSTGGVFSSTAAETFNVTGGGFSGITFGGLDASGNNIIYAVNGLGNTATATVGGLYSLDDTGTNATLTEQVTAPVNTAFRGVAFVAPAAAPEPSSVAGMIIGAGALGMLVARRRRATPVA